MIWSIREKLAAYALKGFKASLKSTGNLDLNQVKSVLILFDFEELNQFSLKLIKAELKASFPNSTFNALCFNKSEKANTELNLEQGVFVLGAKAVGFNLKPKERKWEQTDVIIDLRKQYQSTLQFVLLNSKAKLKLGNRQSWNLDFLDLMLQIEQEKDFKYRANQLAHYLQMIYKKGNAA